MSAIRVAVVGYGNVGRGVIAAIRNNPDMVLAGIVSRSPERVKKEVTGVPVLPLADVKAWVDELRPDVAVLCGGSKNDLPEQTAMINKFVNTVDSFDNHSCIPEYFAKVDASAQGSGFVSVISTGWDPGVFSLERVLANSFLPGCRAYGFYGLGEAGGLSMGHSDALRTIEGVLDARQYTHAVPESIDKVRNGENPQFTPGDMHTRECFVVAAPDADRERITAEIINMPGYFAPYKTVVNFVSMEELKEKYSGFPHDGLVVAAGTTGDGNPARVEYRCQWGSNPEATANILVAHARAAVRLAGEGRKGAFTILDIPPSYFTAMSKAELLSKWI